MKITEDIILGLTMRARIEGPLKLDSGLFRMFLSLLEDPLPEFAGPTPKLRGRGKDHPRYGRWMHAFVRFYKPDLVVEVGTNAGGTAVGIARGLVENGKGRLICVDSGEGHPRSFPDVARKNILACGLEQNRFELINEDSRTAVPRLSLELKDKADIYLVDAAHTFEAAMADMINGLPMIKKSGFIMVHDVARNLYLGDEVSAGHPHPVCEAFHEVVRQYGFDWCILKFIRKHLGVMRVR